MVKKLLLGLLALFALLIAVVAVNTLRKGSRQLDVPSLSVLAVDEAGAAQRKNTKIQEKKKKMKK